MQRVHSVGLRVDDQFVCSYDGLVRWNLSIGCFHTICNSHYWIGLGSPLLEFVWEVLFYVYRFCSKLSLVFPDIHSDQWKGVFFKMASKMAIESLKLTSLILILEEGCREQPPRGANKTNKNGNAYSLGQPPGDPRIIQTRSLEHNKCRGGSLHIPP